MSWSTPKTWAFKETLSSSDLNTYVRDNTNALRDGSGLASGAIGNIDSSDTFIDPAVTAAAYSSISMSKSFTTTGGPTAYIFSVNARFQSANTSCFCQMRLKRTGTVIQTSGIWGGTGVTNMRMPQTLGFTETPAAGTYTYDIEVQNVNVLGTINVDDANLVLITYKI